ncbi:putative leucine rich repeat and sterile alpha motif containing 1 [Operophtera brumata]|uniref:Putative leucine rich repeat and sterile alpha motif containing 1 n=1 Tax=Operophtera brumata TaxID=104452 RepID=A0A0L7LKX1_OPEBR|nr:putative leucine rich repeat and sterile alpha motif containing 1 [Operophtera brumata]
MSLFGRHSADETDSRAKLERKLYIAKESPEADFDLSDCQLKQVPSGTYSLCKVYRKELLYLQDNKLQSLEGGGQLSDLYLIKVLNLSSNKISLLPHDIRYLINLTELHIQNNLIKIIPDSIQCMESLQVLDLSSNKLRNLTPSLGKLKNLRKLDISDNTDLDELCSELCLAANIVQIELDGNQFKFPSSEICSQGTEAIMRYLCKSMDVEYSAPVTVVSSPVSGHTPSSIQNPFIRSSTMTWEEQEAALMEQENKLHQVAKEQREKFLSNIIQNQLVLDNEIFKVQEAKEVERQKLILAIQDDEKDIECLVKNFIQSDYLGPEVVQQQLAYEQAEHNRLLEIVRQNYDNLRKADVMRSIEALMVEDYTMQDSTTRYRDHLNNMKQSLLTQDLEGAEKLEELLKAKDQSRTLLVEKLLDDQDIQKALVASLLERVDTRSWSLNQEISLISSHLAKLSVIEQEKKKLHIGYNYNELLQQRVHLVNLLDDLFSQQNKRRMQLVDTLKEMETESSRSSDFWLKSYQRLIDTAPRTLLDVGKSLDPVLANYLLQEGVIHCLPFLVKFIFSDDSLMEISHEKLKANGVTLTSDREGIIRAIKWYVGAKSQNHNYEVATCMEPNAPSKEILDVEEQNCTGVVSNNETEVTIMESECVICMDARCEVVFVPCGHMCCCQPCSVKDMDSCPMCRSNIDRTIKVIVA